MRRSVSGSFLKSLRKSSFLCLYVGLRTYTSERCEWKKPALSAKAKTLRRELPKTSGYLHYTSSAFSETKRKRCSEFNCMNMYILSLKQTKQSKLALITYLNILSLTVHNSVQVIPKIKNIHRCLN